MWTGCTIAAHILIHPLYTPSHYTLEHPHTTHWTPHTLTLYTGPHTPSLFSHHTLFHIVHDTFPHSTVYTHTHTPVSLSTSPHSSSLSVGRLRERRVTVAFNRDIRRYESAGSRPSSLELGREATKIKVNVAKMGAMLLYCSLVPRLSLFLSRYHRKHKLTAS